MGRRIKLPFAGALAAAALLAGCGEVQPASIKPAEDNGRGNASGGSAALSKSAVIEQGDAICGEANAALASLDSGAIGNDPALNVSQELQITRSELDSLQSLTPPPQKRPTLNDFLAAVEDEVVALAHKKAALEQSNAKTAAESYGFKECAKAKGDHGTAADATETTAPPPSASTTPTTPTTTPTTPATATTTPAAPEAPAEPEAPATPPATGGAGGAAGGGAAGGAGTGGGTGGTGGSGGVSP